MSFLTVTSQSSSGPRLVFFTHGFVLFFYKCHLLRAFIQSVLWWLAEFYEKSSEPLTLKPLSLLPGVSELVCLL